MRRTSIYSSSEGETPPVNMEPEKLKVSAQSVVDKLNQLMNAETVDTNLSGKADTLKDNSVDPSLQLTTVSEGSPSPTWTYHVVDGTHQSQIFNNLKEAVSQSPKGAIVEMRQNSIKEENNSEIEIIKKDDCVIPPVQVSPTVTLGQKSSALSAFDTLIRNTYTYTHTHIYIHTLTHAYIYTPLFIFNHSHIFHFSFSNSNNSLSSFTLK
jgi:hypothetical protein